MPKNPTPINRIGKFFDSKDFDLEMDFGMEYVEEDMGQTIILYEVDLERTNVTDTYKEANRDNIRFKTPKELVVVYEIEQSITKSYDTMMSNAVYSLPGNLRFGIFQKSLDEQHCDIKRGDYIGVPVDTGRMLYFVVTDDGRVNSANDHTVFGYKPFYRTILAAPVDKVEMNGMS